MTGTAASINLKWALWYAKLGWPVFPVHWIRADGHCSCAKDCADNAGKHPLTQHGFKDASTDPATIRHWWTKWPKANVGIRTGNFSKLLVMDIDADHGGYKSFLELEKELGPLPHSPALKTGGGGTHLYFMLPGAAIKNIVGVAPGIDVRTEGGYVVAPPSCHASGKYYQWFKGHRPGQITLPDLPREWVKRLVSAPTSEKTAPTSDKIREGQRNTFLASLAGSMRRRGTTLEAITAALKAENKGRCSPPLPDSEVEKIAASISQYPPASRGRQSERESAATVLIELAKSNADFFHQGDACYATIHLSGHRENHALRSTGFKRWLARLFYEDSGRAASSEALGSAINALEGYATFGCDERQIFIRVGERDGKIYLDLGNSNWEVVEISRDGWQVVRAEQCRVNFLRPRGMLPLPTPERGGDLNELRQFVSCGDDDNFRLIIGWLVGALNPNGPYPILIVHGEQGAAKSTAQRILRSLVDPNKASLRSGPRDARDLMIMASNSWVCSFDNMSIIPFWLSDALCCLSTGGGFSTRALYTDGEEIILEAKRPIILNGIEELVTRGDMLDRSMVIHLPGIADDKRRDETSFNSDFATAQPCLLGGLLDAVSSALAHVKRIRIRRMPRMADAAIWITAAEKGLGWEPGSFLKAHAANRRATHDLPLETPVAEAIRKLPMPWTGTATELLDELESLVFDEDRKFRPKMWPASGSSLSNTLRRLAPNLRQARIDVQFTRNPGDGRRIITIQKIARNPASPSSRAAPNP